MDSGINTVLRIFIIIFCVILAVSLFYVFTVKYLDGYYSPDKDDAFMTSMQIRDIFPMDDGSLFVVGSYLEGDDILSNTSIFVKTYDRNGKPVNIGGFSGRYGFEYRQAVSDGSRVLIELADSKGGAAVYEISGECRISGSGVFASEGPEENIKAYSCLTDSEVCVLTVRNGGVLSFNTLSGETLFNVSLSDDIEISGVYFAGGKFFVTGTVDAGGARSPYISAFERSGSERFSVNVSQKEYEYKVENIFDGADGKVYVTGRRFDTEAFGETVKTADGKEFTGQELADIASKAIGRANGYCEVLLASDYANDPWCSFFISEIDAQSGRLGLINTPLEVSPSAGVSSFRPVAISASEKARDTGARTPLALIVSKTAPTAASGSYAVSCHYLYADMTLSDSAIIHVPCNYYYYPGLLSDGRLFAYLGSYDSYGTVTFNLKFYKSTSEMATAQNWLSILKSSVTGIRNIISVRFMFYVSLFLLFYITSRYTGAEFARNHKARAD